ncbi:hypothetical protein [Methylopila sp. M107]|uniref:hypothetical protein n=1 Tax=Methylopila sp. M107 TaxID=1101190 RepID=UPI001FDAC1E5|nr:hypothetical protein [Methylopila sp. M107]
MTPAEMLKRQGFFPLPGAFASIAPDAAKAIKAQIGVEAQDAAGIGDAFNKISSVRDVFYDDAVKAAYEKVFPAKPTFLQACDIHNGFVQGNWHRDCANKNLKKGPDWDESASAYTNYKLMIYLECDDYSFCVKPRTNSKKLGEPEGEEKYFTVSVEDAAKTDFSRVEQPVQFIPKPGDAVMFDLRTVHRGQGLNSEQFSKRASNKLTLSYVFADRNPHAHRFHSFRTMLKKGYKPFDAAVTRRLEDAGLWWDRLSTNYFDSHKDELDFVVLK